MSQTPPIQWHEPVQITQGDTLSFTRRLREYPAGLGWYMLYAMRGGAQPITFQSTPNGDDHVILVAAAITETWFPAEYSLEGWAVFTDGTRHQVYLAPLHVTPDLATIPGDAQVTTHAQRMLANIETQLEALSLNVLDATDIEGTRIQREKRLSLYELRTKYLHERQAEVNRERSKSGLPNRRKIRTVFSITPPGAVGIRQFGAGNSVFNDAWP